MKKYVNSAISLEDSNAVIDELYMLFDEMSDEDIIELWNKAVGIDNDCKIEDMDYIDERFSEWEPGDLIELGYNWDRFNRNDAYFTLENGSFSDLLGKESPLERSILADAIIRLNDSFDNDEVQDILGKYQS